MTLDVITNPRDLRKPWDAVIVGSGAAGAVLANRLGRAGISVVVLDKGQYYPDGWIRNADEESLLRLWKASGEQLSRSFSVNVAQAECLGGGTVINWGICFDTPEPVQAYWRDRFGFPYSAGEMADAFRRLRGELSVQRVQNAGRAHEVVEQGVQKLGYSGGWMDRNSAGGVKQAATVAFLGGGLALAPGCEATTVLRENGRAAGVRAMWTSPGGGRREQVEIPSKAVILSAGAIASSAFLLRGRLGTRSGHVGRHLSIHPGAAVLGEFDEEVNTDVRYPMAYYCDEFAVRRTGKPGFVIESTVLPPYQFGLNVARFGEDHAAIMRRYRHFVLAGVLVHDEPGGAVRLNWADDGVIDYDLTPYDGEKMVQGLQEAARILLAAGATRVITPHFAPLEIRRNSEIARIRARGILGPGMIASATPHPQGGNRMGGNAAYCVVDGQCRVAGMKNLFVCDASVFPTSVGVNPQLTVMAIADLTAEHIVENEERYFA